MLEASLRHAYHRQVALTNNVANVETPHYRRQDVDSEAFRDMLKEAVHDREEIHPGTWRLPERPSQGWRVEAHRYPEVPVRGDQVYPSPRDPGVVRHDENNVVIESELVELQKNTLALQALQRLFAKAVNSPLNAVRFQVQS